MPSNLSITSDLALILVAPAPQPGLAVDLLAAHVGLPRGEALARLSGGPGVLATGLAQGRGRRLVTLLGLLGLRVRLAAADVGPVQRQAPELLFDLALQASRNHGQRAAAAERLAPDLGLSPAAAVLAFARPGGLVLPGLNWAAVAAWRARTRGLVGVQVLVSDVQAAVHDLMPWDRPADPTSLGPLLRHLRRLGLAPCPLTGAIAAGLDARLAAHVLARFPQSGIVAMNRDFQRFDVELAGAPDPARHELAAFLATRTHLPVAAFARPGPAAGQRIETALSRADALAFQADYAAIGLETRLCLVLERSGGGV